MSPQQRQNRARQQFDARMKSLDPSALSFQDQMLFFLNAEMTVVKEHLGDLSRSHEDVVTNALDLRRICEAIDTRVESLETAPREAVHLTVREVNTVRSVITTVKWCVRGTFAALGTICVTAAGLLVKQHLGG